jgi:AcrR family transcriptional regulator
MTTDIPGGGDPGRGGGDPAGRRPGPRPSLDIDRIVAAAVGLADREGLAALSMRRVATELGVGAMTLYGHVPGKAELAALMLDDVLAELYADGPPAGNWRARLEAVARANWNLFLRHPWAVRLAPGGPPPGPHAVRKYELELRAVDGLGLREDQMDLLVRLVSDFVRGTVAQGPAGEAIDIDPQRFPTAARVASQAGDSAPQRSFEFGLERLLDGIGVLILDASR